MLISIKRSAKMGYGNCSYIAGTLGAFAGHHQGQYITKVQPMKMAAMEALVGNTRSSSILFGS